MNFAVKRLKLILRSFEILNYEMKSLKFQKVEDFNSTNLVYLGFTHYINYYSTCTFIQYFRLVYKVGIKEGP